jgi:uncharacterized protein
VNDYAQVLDVGSERAIEGRLIDFERATSTQIVVATIPSLDGQAIEDVAARTLERWGLGQKDRNNGVLLLISVGDRRARIEVGYGLEDRLTDALSRRILEDRLFPAFRAGDYAGGVRATCEGIIEATRGAYVALPPRKKKSPPLAALLIPLVVVIAFILLGLQGGGGFGGRGRRRTFRSGPIWWSGGGWGSGGGGGGGFGGLSGGGGGGFGGFSGGGGMSGGGGASGSW